MSSSLFHSLRMLRILSQRTQPVFCCSKSAMKTSKQCAKSVQSSHLKNVIDIVLLSLQLTLNRFHILLPCFHKQIIKIGLPLLKLNFFLTFCLLGAGPSFVSLAKDIDLRFFFPTSTAGTSGKPVIFIKISLSPWFLLAINFIQEL